MTSSMLVALDLIMVMVMIVVMLIMRPRPQGSHLGLDLKAFAFFEVQRKRNVIAGMKRLAQSNQHDMQTGWLQGHLFASFNLDCLDLDHSRDVILHDMIVQFASLRRRALHCD